MYGLYPGNVLSTKRTPEFVEPIKAVLEQRGDGATGWSRAWKMNLWARLYDGDRANSIYKGYLKEQCTKSLFALCGTALQVDASFGLTAAVTEMIVQSHEGVIDLLPALPSEWSNGHFDGVCVRGGFELDIKWQEKKITSLEIKSKTGNTCKILAKGNFKVMDDKTEIKTKQNKDGSLQFETTEGNTYQLIRI